MLCSAAGAHTVHCRVLALPLTSCARTVDYLQYVWGVYAAIVVVFYFIKTKHTNDSFFTQLVRYAARWRCAGLLCSHSARAHA